MVYIHQMFDRYVVSHLWLSGWVCVHADCVSSCEHASGNAGGDP